VGLTDDQKAMLRLLAQREEGYQDMAALMGISVGQVKERVKEALAELDAPSAGAAPASAVAPAEPEQTEEEPPPPPAEPKRAEPPRRAQSPKRMPKPSPRRAPAARRAAQVPRPKLPSDRSALIGLAAGVAVVAILVIVLILGGDDGSEPATTGSNVSGAIEASAENPNLTQAILSPVDAGEATGRALFGRFRQSILLQVEAEGLDPSPEGQSYALWLSRGPRTVVPVGTGKVDDSGRLVARYPLPEAVLALVARGTLDGVDLTLADDTSLSAAVARSRRTGRMPTYTGTPVMRGSISGPLVGAAPRGGNR
jgi:hypothetical protein